MPKIRIPLKKVGLVLGAINAALLISIGGIDISLPNNNKYLISKKMYIYCTNNIKIITILKENK